MRQAIDESKNSYEYRKWRAIPTVVCLTGQERPSVSVDSQTTQLQLYARRALAYEAR